MNQRESNVDTESRLIILQHDMDSLKGQHTKFQIDLDSLKVKVSELEVEDATMLGKIDAFIARAEEKWSQDTTNWQWMKKVSVAVGVFAFVAAIENWQNIITLIHRIF